MKASKILKECLKILKDRGIQYNNEEDGERSMKEVVKAFNILTHNNLTIEQGWLFMVVLKMSRSQQGHSKLDDYVDGANYFALAGEEALQNSKKENNPFLPSFMKKSEK